MAVCGTARIKWQGVSMKGDWEGRWYRQNPDKRRLHERKRYWLAKGYSLAQALQRASAPPTWHSKPQAATDALRAFASLPLVTQ